MSETLEYIESYFEKKLGPADKQAFEQRCVQDEAFAGEVAFYVTSREAVRQKLLEQKREAWASHENHTTPQAAAPAPVRKMVFTRWLPYAVAACLVLAACVYFLYPSQTPQRLADTYVQKNLIRLDQTMDGSKDSLQLGISAYNRGGYDTALNLFQLVYVAHPDNSDAKEYTGLAYLMTKDYDKALAHFGELAAKKLFSNRGAFLQAVTLLERNKKGDKEAAKKMLEQVRDERLEGNKEAADWLSKW